MATVLIEIPDGQDRQHRATLRRAVEKVDGTVRIASAYVTDTALLSGLKGRDLRLLTYISRRDIVSGATRPESLIELINAGVLCRYLIEEPKLHAKVYIFGLEDAVVTSANLTKKALNENLEVGVRLSGTDITELVTWFDMLWNIAEELDSELAAVWLKETEEERNQFSSLEKANNKRPKLSMRKTKTLEHFLEGTGRFFVCNTNRRNSLNDEKSMHDRGYATAWEKFNYPTHMNRVEAGDSIYMYAKGKGIVGVGRAKGPVEKLESGARNRVVADGEREWRIPTEWLAWNGDRPFRWNSPNATFFDISAAKYEGLRKGLKKHFSEIR
jgi:hypothetical protein